MTIKSSGTISIQDIVDEFGGDAPHSLTEYYRGGGRVPDIPQNDHIPTSGTISLTDFYGAVNEIVRTITTGGLKASFGAFWGQNVPKRAIINGGVTRALLNIEPGMSGTLVIDNYGEIQGYGGSENRNGGDAIIANSDNVIINNHGAIRSGGGGGGHGGAGGRGSYPTTIRDGEQYSKGRYHYYIFGSLTSVYWNGQKIYSNQHAAFHSTSQRIGNITYYRGTFHQGTAGNGYYGVSRVRPTTSSTNGGTGGAGGRGQGYGQGKQNGSAGRTGGRNAGRGGNGGNGGTWGGNGGTGQTGANGNVSHGSVGHGGGRAGISIRKNGHSVAINNLGTINGSVA